MEVAPKLKFLLTFQRYVNDMVNHFKTSEDTFKYRLSISKNYVSLFHQIAPHSLVLLIWVVWGQSSSWLAQITNGNLQSWLWLKRSQINFG